MRRLWREVVSLAAVLVLGACGAEVQAPEEVASRGATLNADLGNDFSGNYLWVHGVRSQAADAKYPCLNEVRACLALDASGQSEALMDLCPSIDTPEGSWRFEYALYADACETPLANVACVISQAEQLAPGANHNRVECLTSNAQKDFEVCLYDPVTGAGFGHCETRVGVMGGFFYTDDLRAFLDADPGIVATNVYACDLATLSQFDVVWLYGNMNCFDPGAFDAYAAGGGGIVATPWVLRNYGGFVSLPVENVLGPPFFHGPLDVTVTDPSDPLLAGVAFVAGDDVGHEMSALKAGTTSSVDWNDGSPAVVKWGYGTGRVVYLNFHYITSDCGRAVAYGWGQQLSLNATDWAAKRL